MIEFQITHEKFLELIHQRLQLSRPCFKNPILIFDKPFYVNQVQVKEGSLGLAKETQSFALNELLPAGIFEDFSTGGKVGVPSTDAVKVDRRTLRLSQKVVVDLVDQSKLIESGSEEPKDVIPREVLMVFELSIFIFEDGSPALCVHLFDIPELMESLEPEKAEQLLNTWRQEVDRCEFFDFGAIAASMGVAFPKIINGGITVTSGANKMVVIRLDLEPKRPDAKEFWTKFYTGAITARLFGSQWSLLMPAGLITSLTNDKILQGIKQQSRFKLSSGPATEWAPEGNSPGLNTSVGGEIIDACAEIDMDAQVEIRATMTVPKENLLRTTINMDWEGEFLEEAGCLLAAAIAWPVVGGLLLSDDGIGAGMFVGGFFIPFPAIIVIGILYLNSDKPLGKFKPEGWVEDSKTQRHQDQPFPSQVGFIEGIKLTSVFGVPEGMVLAGKLDLALPLLPKLRIGQNKKFDWKVDDPCNAPTAICEPAGLGIIADPMGVEPRVPLVICSVKVINDPQGLYKIKQWDHFVTASTTLKIEFVGASANPYDCQVLIITNAGVRVVTVAPPSSGPKVSVPNLKDPDKFNDWLKWKGTHCWLTSSIWTETGLFNPQWHIDPGPFDYAQHWWIGLSGLNAGDIVSLNDISQGELLSATVGANGKAELNAMIEQPQKDSALMISRNGARMELREFQSRIRGFTPPREAPRSELNIKQVLLLRTGTIAPVGEFRQMSLGYYEGQPALLVVTTAGLSIYELESGVTPRRRFISLTRGVLGAMPHRGELITWGRHGLGPASKAMNVGRSLGPCSAANATLDFTINGDFAYALERDGMRIYDWDLCPIGKVESSGAHRLAVAHDRLVTVKRDSLEVFDLTRPAMPERASSISVQGIDRVECVRGASARRKVYVQTTEGGRVFDLTDAKTPKEVARYRTRPWYSETVRRGTFVARYDPERRRINLYRIADSISGLEPRPRVTDIWRSRGK